MTEHAAPKLCIARQRQQSRRAAAVTALHGKRSREAAAFGKR